MTSGSFTDYLAGLDEAALAGLLRARPDVRVEPVPRGFEQLAQRLGSPESLRAALWTVDRDVIVLTQAVAVLGPRATVDAVSDLVAGPEPAVRRAVDVLIDRGLGWPGAAAIQLPEWLAAYWSAQIGQGRPMATVARQVLVDDLRATAAGHGIAVIGLRKPELIAALTSAVSDIRALAEVVHKLPAPARKRLDELRQGYGDYLSSYVRPDRSVDSVLAAAGLVVQVNRRWEVPQEVGAAAWLAQQDLRVTGPPEIPVAAGTASAQAAAHDLLRGVTVLLDEARSTSITALKKGGVGARERSRLSARLALPTELVTVGIDLSYSAGLLGLAESGYAPTEEYAVWRAAAPAEQWSALAIAWFNAEHAPTSREIEGDKELPPPLPLASAARELRRGVLRAARGGRSVSAVSDHVGWFVPLHGYSDDQVRDKLAAVVREGELLGVIAADALTDCGEQLVAVLGADPLDADSAGPEAVDKLAERVADVLVETPCTVILQSDLTAVVSGQPTAAVARLLGAAAASEARGPAGVWRFGPGSVRSALDAGWTAEQLLAELAAMTDRPVPQPLEYLVNDVARKHGSVRVRGMRACVIADEAVITELLHTRSLAKLSFARVAPTVLSSPYELDEVLARIRAAGMSPVAEDATGAVIVEERAEHTADRAPVRTGSRPRMDAAKLAERLLADPSGANDEPVVTSELGEKLALLNPKLTDTELILLADAIEQQRDVRITYRNKTGNRTVRDIQPTRLYGAWLDAWCHLRNGQRDFTVSNIESVAPA